MRIRLGVCLLLALASVPSLFGADVNMQVTDKNYLNTQGFSVFLYDSTYHPVFVDQKNTAMEMILHGQRIATNGDVRLMPTPEQWDLVATLKGRHADKENNRLTANLAFPSFDLSYTLEVAAEPGGVKVSINLDKPLPEKLAGRAGFNLEFLPSIYMGKAYLVDGTKAGIFPRTPDDPMVKVMPLVDEPKKAYYLEDWDKAKGYTQPLPFAQGKTITLGVDDALARVKVTSDTSDLMLFDGRNRAQNGWFVLRSLIPSGKTTGAIVWHIHPDVIPNWTRPPMVAHSQVGYVPEFSKVAVIELDPKYDAPKTAKVLRLTEDGSYKQVFEGPITPSIPWLRYVYSKFDFTPIKDPGLYVIEYAGQRTAPFPISKDAYANIWQDSLDHHIAEQMDHVAVREGYRVWHGASHLDDGRMAPVVGEQFDGWNQATATDGKWKGGDHIPGMNVGGWYDAGDFDLEEPAQLNVIQSLALAYREFNLKYDELTVDETTRQVEMHRPDGVPDTVEQVKHGALLILAQFHNIGHAIRGTHEPDLRQYTHLGDGASKTDGRIYDPKLGPNEVKGDYSGRPDDRWIFTTNNPFFQWNAIAALAAASDTLKGYDDALAKDCLDTAIKAYNDEKAHPTPFPSGGWGGAPGSAPANGVLAASQGTTAGAQPHSNPPASSTPPPPPAGARGNFGPAMEWTATLELTIATHGAEPYKSRLKELFPQMITPQRMDFGGWTAVRALPWLDPAAKDQMHEAVKTYMEGFDKKMEATPFGVPPSLGTWGGSGAVVDMAIRMYFLHKAFPDLVGPEYTLRAVNYILGTHPVSSTSYVAGVGTVSKTKTYSNNRGDNAFIPGAVIPGYIIIKPDFLECIDDFGFLWFEDEAVVAGSASWVVAGNAAEALTHESK
ncbi:glycoside hydrolase family 9 protein [Occallatibacter riparius]|uniref:Glycoside hydrolase family 9 protein n=1 Tax=Occallatibacter riparius TaxID=1002689 RepID=A0A9J7BPC5_9BACT|nr:glycoside hydrolase family 9 protein [Occallatibacter riparius]UWZ84603.1 glycoside hydrolase family 9 protein [Occallatibacter riparius]